MSTEHTFDETMAELDRNIQRIKAEIGREESAFEPLERPVPERGSPSTERD